MSLVELITKHGVDEVISMTFDNEAELIDCFPGLEHPIWFAFTKDKEGSMKIINRFYHRNFNLLHKITDYYEPDCPLTDMLESLGLDEFKNLLKKYEVKPEEFDMSMLDEWEPIYFETKN